MDSTLNQRELARADEPLSRLEEQLSKLAHDAELHPSGPQTAAKNIFRPAASDARGNRISRGRWALHGSAGLLLAAGIGVAGIIWLGSPGDAAKTAPSQPAPLADAAPTAALSPELTPLLQAIARDLASMGKEIGQLKAGRELMVRDNANLSEQLKADKEQLTRAVVGLSEQLKASLEQVSRDNAIVAGQISGIQDQLARVVSHAPEQTAPPKRAASPGRPTPPAPQQAAPAARAPAPKLSTAQAAAQPKAEKPKLSSTSRPPTR
jgi:hypothetical protein